MCRIILGLNLIISSLQKRRRGKKLCEGCAPERSVPIVQFCLFVSEVSCKLLWVFCWLCWKSRMPVCNRESESRARSGLSQVGLHTEQSQILGTNQCQIEISPGATSPCGRGLMKAFSHLPTSVLRGGPLTSVFTILSPALGVCLARGHAQEISTE